MNPSHSRAEKRRRRFTRTAWLAGLFTFAVAAAVGGPPVSITSNPPNQATRVDEMFPISLGAIVRDASGVSLAGYSVTFSSPSTGASATFTDFNGPHAITAVTDQNGAFANAYANGIAGTYNVTASLITPSLTVLTTTFTLTNTGILSLITALPGTTPQSAPAGVSFQPLVVKAGDQNNYPLAGIAVTFTAPSSGASGTFSNGTDAITVASDGSGNASVTLLANAVTGSYAVTVTATDQIGHSARGITLALTNAPPPAGILALPGTTPQSALVGTSFQPLGVSVTDAGNNPVPGVSVTFMIPTFGPSGIFGAGSTVATVTSDSTGNAISPSLRANSIAGGPYLAIATTVISGALASVNFSLTNTAASSLPTITRDPSNTTVTANSTAAFTAAATGNPTPTVQWQQSTDGGVTFTNIPGATSTTLSFIATSAQNNYQFRAVFTNSVGPATTTAASLTVAVSPEPNVQTISHIADGGGWRSSIILEDTDTVPAQYTVSFRSDAGASYVPPLGLGTASGTIPVGGSTIIETTDTAAALSEGWAVVTSNQSIGGTAIFRYDPSGQEAAVPLLASGGMKLKVPYQVGSGLALGIALANPSATQTANITEVIRDQNGNQLASRAFTLAALNHTAFLPTFPSTITGGGVVEYDTDVNIYALGIRSAGQAFTSVPATE